jgi:hypothetical protein
MYIIEYKDMVVDDPYPMYQIETELIEAEGEAQDEWVNITADNGYPDRSFTMIDDISEEDIELDIVDYIGHKAYDLIDSIVLNMGEDEELTYTKLNSWLIASIRKA